MLLLQRFEHGCHDKADSSDRQMQVGGLRRHVPWDDNMIVSLCCSLPRQPKLHETPAAHACVYKVYIVQSGSGSTLLQSGDMLTCDDNIKVLQPVLILLTANSVTKQEVHDDVGVVPQRVSSHKQLLASCPVHVQNACQACVLMNVLGWVLGHCLLQTSISVTQIHGCSNIPTQQTDIVTRVLG